jgi:hypothetical protein
MSNNLRELKPHPGFTPIAEPAEPHPGTLSPFKVPVLPNVADKAPVAIAQGAVRAATGNQAEIGEE